LSLADAARDVGWCAHDTEQNTALALGSFRFAAPVAPPGVQRNAHPARAATPFMFKANGELSRARPRRNVDHCPPRNWCRLLVLIFRDALTSLNRGQEDEPTELGPG
jgi:hypothetical protein